MPQSALLPELLSRVIELVKGELDVGSYHDESFHSFLVQTSLVCRMWAEETRPFIFHSVRFAFGSEEVEAPSIPETPVAGPATLVAFRQRAHAIIHQALGNSQGLVTKQRRSVPQAMRRVEKFLALLQHNPKIATFVKSLHLEGPESNSTKELNESSDVLLAFFSILSNIQSVRLFVRPATPEIRLDWWENRLEDTTRSAITFLLARPTLEILTLEGTVIPCAIWDPHALKCVDLLEALSNTNSGILQSERAPVRPNPQARFFPLPEAFGRISNLVLCEKLRCMEDIHRMLLRSRRTLTKLQLILCVDPDDDYPASTQHKPIPTVDFTNLKQLREVAFIPVFHNVSPDNVGPYTLQTLDTLTWAHIEILCVGVTFKCPESREHPRFDVQAYCKSLDSFIWGKARLHSHVDIIHDMHGEARKSKPRLQFVASALDLQMCNTCLHGYSESIAQPSDDSDSDSNSNWQIPRLFPNLYKASKLGLGGEEKFGLAVRAHWLNPHANGKW